MSTSKPARSEDGYRVFTCKKCAQEVREPLRIWKKKKQQDKRICEACIKRRADAIIDAEERRRNNPFPYGYMGGMF